MRVITFFHYRYLYKSVLHENLQQISLKLYLTFRLNVHGKEIEMQKKKSKAKEIFVFSNNEFIIGKYVPLHPEDNLQNTAF